MKIKAMFVAVVAVNLAAVADAGRADEPPAPVVLKGHTGEVSAVAWAADGKALATAGYDRTVRVWEPANGRQTAFLPAIPREKWYGSTVLAFSPDLKVVADYYSGEITLRAVADGKVLVKIDPILDRGEKAATRPDVYAMAFSPDGKRLVSGGSVAAVGGDHGLPGGIVVVWDAQTGKLLHKSKKLSTAACSVAWGPDGKRFAAGTHGNGAELPEVGELRVWDAETGDDFRTFKVAPGVYPAGWASAGDVALGPGNRRIATPLTAGGRGNPFGVLKDDTGGPVRIWAVPASR